MATPEADLENLSLDAQRKAAKEAKKKAKEEKLKQKAEKGNQGACAAVYTQRIVTLLATCVDAECF